MDNTAILKTAASLLEAHGDKAKFLVAERIDQALEAGDGGQHDFWCLVGKAVALLSMPRAETVVTKAAPASADAPRQAFKAA